MNFASDNAYGVSQPIMNALAAANGGAVASYGGDDLTKAVERRFGEIFERDVAVFQLVTGTAANALALSAYTPPWGAVFCHSGSHVMTDECGAPEFYSGGAKLVGIDGAGGKITAGVLRGTLERFPSGDAHFVKASCLSLSQATELGTTYTVAELNDLTAVARDYGMAVHMDGARFANAMVNNNVTPAEMTWKAGIDILSFGATKNGAMAAEAVIMFDRAKAEELLYRRMRGGHMLSKARFIAAQLLAYLEDDHWLDLARTANGLARKLADGLAATGKARIDLPVEANELFPVLSAAACKALKDAGAAFHPWLIAADDFSGSGEIRVRMVTSFDTPEADVDRAIGIVANS